MSSRLQQQVDLDRIFRFTLDAILGSIFGNPSPPASVDVRPR